MEDATIIGLYWARDEGAIAASDEKYGWLCRNLSQNILDSREDAEGSEEHTSELQSLSC